MAGTSTLQAVKIKQTKSNQPSNNESSMEQPKQIVEVADQEVHHLSDKAIKDYKLVRKAVDNGDQKAYAELMSRYKDSIYYMLLKMVNNRDDAEDLTIEAFGKAFRNIRQYTPDYAFSTWLFKIATNNCIDFIRKKRKLMLSIDRGFENEEGQDVSLEVRSDGPGPDDVMMKKQKVMMMKDVVDKLKPRYRRLVELRYYQELSYEEIAVELNLPLGTVKAQLFRAREFLYQIMKNSEYVIH
jgi:RNA polymerase sigma factor (sigma-70 family)